MKEKIKKILLEILTSQYDYGNIENGGIGGDEATDLIFESFKKHCIRFGKWRYYLEPEPDDSNEIKEDEIYTAWNNKNPETISETIKLPEIDPSKVRQGNEGTKRKGPDNTKPQEPKVRTLSEGNHPKRITKKHIILPKVDPNKVRLMNEGVKSKKISDTEVVGIVKAKHWYGINTQFFNTVSPEDYVVCRWHDFHDGEKSNIEGKVTIAICRHLEDAELIYCTKNKK